MDLFVESIVVARLADPDIASRLFAKGDPASAREAMDNLAAIDAKLALVTDQYADDEMTADQFKRMTARLRDKRAVEDARLRASAPNDRIEQFLGGDVRAVWEAAPIAARREVIETLFTITIDPQGPGKPFDPELIRVDWKSE